MFLKQPIFWCWIPIGMGWVPTEHSQTSRNQLVNISVLTNNWWPIWNPTLIPGGVTSQGEMLLLRSWEMYWESALGCNQTAQWLTWNQIQVLSCCKPSDGTSLMNTEKASFWPNYMEPTYAHNQPTVDKTKHSEWFCFFCMYIYIYIHKSIIRISTRC